MKGAAPARSGRGAGATGADPAPPVGPGADAPPLVRLTGLHPLAAFALVAVDAMLFAAETGSLGAAWVVSVPLGAVLGLGTVLVQRYGMGDGRGAAFGKGVLCGVLTAIPTPIPALVPMAGGVLGALHLLRAGRSRAGAPPTPEGAADPGSEDAVARAKPADRDDPPPVPRP